MDVGDAPSPAVALQDDGFGGDPVKRPVIERASDTPFAGQPCGASAHCAGSPRHLAWHGLRECGVGAQVMRGVFRPVPLHASGLVDERVLRQERERTLSVAASQGGMEAVDNPGRFLQLRRKPEGVLRLFMPVLRVTRRGRGSRGRQGCGEDES